MADVVRWDGKLQNTLLGAEVYLKETWSAEWGEPVPYLHALQVSWSAAPSVSTAMLTLRYGTALREGDQQFATVLRELSRQRSYVRIVMPSDEVEGHPDDDLEWYGTLEVEQDAPHGVRVAAGPASGPTAVQSGRQTFTCYGLEHLLSYQLISQAKWLESNLTERIYDRGLVFNENGQPNRSRVKGPQGCYLFADDVATARYWSTADAVEYLILAMSPSDWLGQPRLPFELAITGALPRSDRPVLETDGRTLRELLNQLMPRQRLLSYYLWVTDIAPQRIIIQPFCFANADLVLDADEVISANPSQKILAYEADLSMATAVKDSSVDRYDYVEVHGAARRNCCTVSRADNTIYTDWSVELKTEYDQGASLAVDYPASAEIEERQRRNAHARQVERLASVYSRFAVYRLDQVGRGVGIGTRHPAAPSDEDPDVSYPLYPPRMALLSTLPLLENYDYANGGEPLGDPPYAERRPMCFVELPDNPLTYQPLERMGAISHHETTDPDDPRTWNGHMRIIENSLRFELRISGEPQHVIAYGTFTPLAEDEAIGHYSYNDFVFTIAFECGRRASASWPPLVTLFLNDTIRKLVIQAGDGYRLDYVAPNTVVGLDPESLELQRLSEGTYIRDDRAELLKVAKLAHAWYGETRKAIELQNSRVTRGIWLGDLIVEIGDPALPVPGDVHIRDVRSCVTDISVEIPIGGPGAPGRRTIRWTTAFGELDPLGFTRAPRN